MTGEGRPCEFGHPITVILNVFHIPSISDINEITNQHLKTLGQCPCGAGKKSIIKLNLVFKLNDQHFALF